MDYKPDHAAFLAKRNEIQALLTTFGTANSPLDSEQSEKLFDGFVAITPPFDPPALATFTLMSDLGRGGGVSRKPGNIRLNWRKLFELIPDVTLAGAGSVGVRWLIPFAALYIWMKLWKTAAIKIEEKDAFVLYSLWLHRNSEHKIVEDDAYSKTLTLSQKHGLSVLERKEFDEAINKLLSLECIELDGGVIWLCEWVVVKY